MTTILKSESKQRRGRPRVFDPEAALAVGQRMFHEAGYDAVGLSALTNELGITPPSFYTAFGSKVAFFERVLERYASIELALADILLPHRSPVEALADLLERAARSYAHDPERTGCLVLEAARGHSESESAVLARRVAEQRRAQIREFVAKTHPRRADAATDYVSTVMSGLSGSAREGVSAARLVRVAKLASTGLTTLLA